MNAPTAARPPAESPRGRSRAFLLLAGALLAAVGASAAVRWAGSAQALEEIIQTPVPHVTPSLREEPTAPDPGDNP